MTLTKIEMWFGIITLVLIFSFTIISVGDSLVNSDITLDQKSQDYIVNFSGSVAENNFKDYADNTTLEEKKSNPVVDAITNLPIISDAVGAINFFIDKTKTVMDALAVVYNLPTFFIQGFGLNVGAFRHIINIFSATMLLVFIVIMVRLIK